ncbi:PepSY domain-containing protein [Ottowia testudinis]|uniref:PepSY domain-containing protein n=1 Tax=Ottowia testudinis TaxID=2816950 RepID=A0A975H247_9BURK|nr:PepSY domain-containing protein [Ottowia testudinis]QTD44493.1 PepSY domain-containing protein [Ottowia testudinis]
MNRKTSLAAFIAAVGIATAGGLAYAAQGGAVNDAVADLSQAHITLEQAIAAAQQHHAGAKATKAELESRKGTTFYEVEVVAANQQVFDVRVDAADGKVLSSQADRHDRDNEKNDD